MPSAYKLSSLTRIKPISISLSQNTSAKLLSWYDLAAYGIAATIGSGIYASVGRASRFDTGPGVIISTLLAGLMSMLTALCYLDFASKIPTSGSSYAYAYSSLGELISWFIGWNLTLEYSFAAAAIAGYWTDFLVDTIKFSNGNMPEWLCKIQIYENYFRVNLLALLIIFLIGAIVLRGLQSGVFFNNIITVLNIGIILFIIVAGACYVKVENITNDFVPHGVGGIMSGTVHMVFSYIGFDTICTLSADSKKPKRDVPIAIFVTIGLATCFYASIGVVLNGMVPYMELKESSPLAQAFYTVGATWAYYVVNTCALTTMCATIFACLLGQPHIFKSMAQDGLLPKSFSVSSKKDVPMAASIFTIVLTAFLAGFINVDILADMVSVGCLFGFASTASGLLITRFKRKQETKFPGIIGVSVFFIGTVITSTARLFGAHIDTVIALGCICSALPFLYICFLFFKNWTDLTANDGTFSCPFMPVLPCVSIFINLIVMLEAPIVSVIQFLVWTAIGMIFYFAYGIRHSILNKVSLIDTIDIGNSAESKVGLINFVGHRTE